MVARCTRRTRARPSSTAIASSPLHRAASAASTRMTARADRPRRCPANRAARRHGGTGSRPRAYAYTAADRRAELQQGEDSGRTGRRTPSTCAAHSAARLALVADVRVAAQGVGDGAVDASPLGGQHPLAHRVAGEDVAERVLLAVDVHDDEPAAHGLAHGGGEAVLVELAGARPANRARPDGRERGHPDEVLGVGIDLRGAGQQDVVERRRGRPRRSRRRAVPRR